MKNLTSCIVVYAHFLFIVSFWILIFMDISFAILQMNTELLKQKAEMLEEYFGIHIDEHGNVSRLPVILDQYTPDMDHVPEFALCLCFPFKFEKILLAARFVVNFSLYLNEFIILY